MGKSPAWLATLTSLFSDPQPCRLPVTGYYFWLLAEEGRLCLERKIEGGDQHVEAGYETREGHVVYLNRGGDAIRLYLNRSWGVHEVFAQGIRFDRSYPYGEGFLDADTLTIVRGPKGMVQFRPNSGRSETHVRTSPGLSIPISPLEVGIGWTTVSSSRDGSVVRLLLAKQDLELYLGTDEGIFIPTQVQPQIEIVGITPDIIQVSASLV